MVRSFDERNSVTMPWMETVMPPPPPSNPKYKPNTVSSYDGQLIQLQHMCFAFDIEYTMKTAVGFLKKFNISLTEEQLRCMYDGKELTMISLQ
jgi:hypothetical protein